MVNKSLFFFKDVCVGVNSVNVCTRLLFCFVIVDKISTQLTSFLSKTGLWSRSLIVRLHLSAKKHLMSYLPRIKSNVIGDLKTLNFFEKIFVPRLVSIKIFFSNLSEYFLKSLLMFESLYFLKVLSNQFLRNCWLLLKNIYIVYYFQDRNLLNLQFPKTKCHHYDKRQFCWWHNTFSVIWSKFGLWKN